MRVPRMIIALVVAMLAAVAWVMSAAPAHAKGPTSVLLANRDISRFRVLDNTDKVYERLAAGVGAFGPDIGSTKQPRSFPDNLRAAVRLTWLADEMMILRVDTVYFTTDDGIWIETWNVDRQGDMFKLPAHWHRAVSQTVLMASLTAAGMIAGSDPPVRKSASAVPSAIAPTASQAASTESQAAASSVSGADRAPAPMLAMLTGAGVAGVIVGATAALALTRARRSKAPRVDRSG
jgi:hypothetical protein